MEITFKLNGIETTVLAQPGEYLLDTLRRIGVKSVKKGCDSSVCGACTVLVDEKPVLSCSVLTIRVQGHEVKTVVSIQDEAAELSTYFAAQGADQCGFCTSALALLVHALKKENPHPSDEEIKDYLAGNLCRCTGYQSQGQAIKAYLGGKK